ncbi:MAG: ATP-binding cassette domain-containing protein [Lachnospiraceae bacterium]|nr:ATP-binding cassette domain-containing protein [Lachnospiraceae bacterium]
MILSCQNLSKAFGSDDIIKNVSFQINEGDKVAIVGNNGAGKSTLLKMITGELESDAGSITLAKDATLGYLAQYQNIEGEETVYQTVYSSRQDILNMQGRLQRMEQQMTELQGEALEDLLVKYHQLHDLFEHQNGYAYESEVQGVLRGLGFSEEDFNKTMDMLSGGQKTRVSLGKLLVMKPDILLLDEPINHLDLTSIEWLETFLMNYKGTVVIVAHDRYFLDRIVTKVIDLSMHTAHVYKGNYSAFAMQKEEIRKTMLREYEKQQASIAHQQEVIDKLKQFNREKSIKRAESRQKALDKMEVLEKPVDAENHMQLSLQPDMVSGNDVLELIGLSKSYDGIPLFTNVHFLLQRGEHVAILGDNGTGKTTLLKIINEIVPADAGIFRLGANVTIGYYDQEQQVLDDEKTLFEEMSDTYPNLNNTKIRNVLAAFMFLGDDCYKRIRDLSGGERGRISLAKLMLSGANFLILDEPTNHLDMESKEILENAINAYEGTVLYVSHDRYFVNQTADKILELTNQQFSVYLGNYDYFVEKKAQSQETQNIVSQTTTSSEAEQVESEGKIDWKQQKKLQSEKRKVENRIAEIEEQISECEDTLAKIDEEFAKDDVATNSAKLNELSEKQSKVQAELDTLYAAWEQWSEVLTTDFS